MTIRFLDQGWGDYIYWQENDRAMLRRINRIIRDIQRDPYDGIGKPEALQHELSGYWSRRIDQEHRLVYRMDGETIVVLLCRHHYTLNK